jgi:hypothetical protein
MNGGTEAGRNKHESRNDKPSLFAGLQENSDLLLTKDRMYAEFSRQLAGDEFDEAKLRSFTSEFSCVRPDVTSHQ